MAKEIKVAKLPKQRSDNFTKVIRETNFKRWRNQRGIKLVMSIMPMTGGRKRATALFEAKTYVGIGKTHTEALDNCISAIKKGANLDA